MIRMLGAFRGPKEKITPGKERILKCRQNLLLQIAVQVDQKVAAGNEIESRERRILEKAVIGEENDVPQFALDPIVLTIALEKPPEPILIQIRFDRRRIASLARDSERSGIHVRGEDL